MIKMKSNELRIGNWINHKYSEPNFIVSVINTFNENTVNGIELEDCEPIPLTEEWLLKFGFVFKGIGISGAVCSRHSGHWYKNNNPYFAGTKKPFDIFLQFGQGVEIQHVHQLQNLYFALTNEELCID